MKDIYNINYKIFNYTIISIIMEVIRKYVRFYGRVQGVNFRYTSSTQATKLGLTGWVRNDDDGSVEMEVQGTAELIDQLFETMKTISPYIVIDTIEETTISVEPNESEFVIKY